MSLSWLSSIWVLRLFGLLLLLLMTSIRISDPEILRDARFQLFDYYQQLKPRPFTPQPITIVNLDEASLREFGQWPWPRTRIADLIDRLTEMGAATIAFDIIFAETDRLSPEKIAEDNRDLPPDIIEALGKLSSNESHLARSMRRSRVVVGQTSVREILDNFDTDHEIADVAHVKIGEDPVPFLSHFPQLVENVPALEDAASGRGVFSLEPDPDGIVRRVPMVMLAGGRIRLGLAVETLRVVSGEDSFAIRTSINGIEGLIVARNLIPTDPNGRLWVYYSEPNSARYISAAAVLNKTADPDRFRNHIILIGTSAIGLEDYRPIPLGQLVPGVEVHAQILENIFTDTVLSRNPRALLYEIVATVLAGLLVILIGYRIGATGSGTVAISLIALAVGFAWWNFSQNLILFDVTWPIASILLLSILGMVANYLREERQRRRIQGAFGQYLSPELVGRLSENPDQLVLGGETRNLSVLFTDVRGFTTISESYRENPQGLTALMNEFLTELSEPILQHNGTIDKYMGDAIMAFWNAPTDEQDHAFKACTAALDMLKAVEAMNTRRQASQSTAPGETVHPINVGIGINTGQCVVGNMGSRSRFDYTALGDTVNLAARLEGQSKPYGLPIVVGDATADAVRDRMAVFEVDLIRVRGKNEPARIHCLAGAQDLVADPVFQEFQAINNTMINAYRNRDWKNTQSALKQLMRLGIQLDLPIADYVQIYRTRTMQFTKNPPPKDWDGVYSVN